MASQAVMLKAARIVNQGRIVYIRSDEKGFTAVVRGDSGQLYIVHINPSRKIYKCTCLASAYRKMCKHIVAVMNVLRYLGVLNGTKTKFK